MKYLLLVVILIGCASKPQPLNLKREIASDKLAQAEIYLQSLVKDSVDTYAHLPYTIDVANSLDAIQFTVNYHEDDYVNVYGMGGIRKRNLHVLLNEQYLAIQEKISIQASKNFDVSQAKKIYLKFRQVD